MTGAASYAWAADTAYDEGQMKIGRRLAIKLRPNASKFGAGRRGVTEASCAGLRHGRLRGDQRPGPLFRRPSRPRWRRARHRRVPRVRVRPGAAADRASSGRSRTTTWSS
ncbi:hypothetical protein QJS66_01555 [Kocuria rhizophila]|nr:hypothetical protein QJS66_01555 [Kocuria rhizophila]